MNAPSLLSRRALSTCRSCSRNLLRQRHLSSTPARPTSAFQSYTFPSQLPSVPRNASVPDTLIAKPIPRPHETRPPVMTKQSTPLSPEISNPELEAQQSKAAFASSPTSAASVQQTTPNAAPAPPQPKPRSRLRTPRKAAMKLTPAAVEQLRAMLDQPDPKLIKVGVRNRGCSGLAYHLEYVDKASAFDETVEQDGVRVLVDSKALFSIIGSEMDWVEDKLSQRFVFRNPNISKFSLCSNMEAVRGVC